mgnify:CR=1 FL=1
MTIPAAIPPSPSPPKPRVLHVIQGDCAVSKDPNTICSTILGSCIAACLWDPTTGMGGMNHFLLPEGDDSQTGSQKFGAYAMECLINGLLREGAHRGSLQAKVFGGARMMQGFGDIGSRNAAFVQHFLRAEGIPIVAHDVGGDKARRVKFWPTTGAAKLKWLDSTAAVREVVAPAPVPPADTGEVELF